MAKKKIKVEQIDISIIKKEEMDFICITDIAHKFSDEPKETIRAYLRNCQNIEYMAV